MPKDKKVKDKAAAKAKGAWGKYLKAVVGRDVAVALNGIEVKGSVAAVERDLLILDTPEALVIVPLYAIDVLRMPKDAPEEEPEPEIVEEASDDEDASNEDDDGDDESDDGDDD